MVAEGYSHMDLAKPMNVDYTTLLVSLARYKFVVSQLKKTDDVLDIGCGTGYGTYYMSKFCRYINGIDIDKDQVNDARKQFGKCENLNFLHSDIFEDPEMLPDRDVITCFEVIQDMNRGEAREFLGVIAKNKMPEAVAFISTPRKTDNVTENRKRYHPHEYEFEELREDLENVFTKVIILGQIDEFIGSINKNNVWTYFAICI